MKSRRGQHQVECLKRRLLAREADIQKEIKVTKDVKLRKLLRHLAALTRLGVRYIDDTPNPSMRDPFNEMSQRTWRNAGDVLAEARRVRNRIANEARK